MLNRDDVKAYLYVLHWEPIMHYLPTKPPDITGCLVRLVEQLEGKKDWWHKNLLKNIQERERLNGFYDPDLEQKANFAKLTKTLAMTLYAYYTQTHYSYRKTLKLDGKTYRLTPFTAAEFVMIHGGSLDCFKKDFGYVELSDFTKEELARAEIAIYDGHGMKESWSSFNKCISFPGEPERHIRDWWEEKEPEPEFL